MSVEQAVLGLIGDIDQLNRIFLQLCKVPLEVQELFHLLAEVRSRLTITSRLLLKIDDVPSHWNGQPFIDFRKRLLDVELLIDPEQFLHHSGAGSNNQHSVRWDSSNHGDHISFCMKFKGHVFAINDETTSIITFLNAQVRLTPEAEDAERHNSASPSLSSLRSFALQGSRNPSPTSTPNRHSHGRKKRSPLPKTEEEMIFDRFVQQYTKLGPQGKRKRVGDGDEASLVSLDALSRQLPFPFPAGQHELERMQQLIRGTSNIADADVPEWNLDDLRAALPSSRSESPRSFLTNTTNTTNSVSSSTTVSQQPRGKQRAIYAPSMTSTLHLTEYGMTEHNSSSSDSTRSAPTRPGSMFSVSSRDRMYENGTCKLWHRQGAGPLRQIDIARTEVRRDVQQANGRSDFGITIVCTMPSGHEIKDSLWIPVKGINSSPFLEHIDVVHQFQKNDPNVQFLVRFAPNAGVHPQYSFTNREDCWDFLQAITEKTLCASIDVESVKSAATHASAVEAGTETLQIWEDRQTSKRTVKFFRNKNETATQRVVELDLGWFRTPQKERRTQKTLIELRDSGDPLARELKYLKIVFSNPDAEEGFLHECRFRNHSLSSISTMHSDRFGSSLYNFR